MSGIAYSQDILAENDVHIPINTHVQADNHVGLTEGWRRFERRKGQVIYSSMQYSHTGEDTDGATAYVNPCPRKKNSHPIPSSFDRPLSPKV